MSLADPRTRARRPLKSLSINDPVAPTAIVFPFIVQAVRVVALHFCKEWLLDRGVGSLWVLSRALITATVFSAIAWATSRRNLGRFEWTSLGISSIAIFTQYWSLYAALQRLPTSRVLTFSHASQLWLPSLFTLVSPRRTLYVTAALSISLLSSSYAPTPFDPNPSLRSVSPAHLCLILHSVSSFISHRYLRLLSSETQSKTSATVLSTAGAALISAAFAFIQSFVPNQPANFSVPLKSQLSLPLLAIASIYSPEVLSALSPTQPSRTPPPSLSFPSEFFFSFFFGLLTFRQSVGLTDFAIGALVYFALRSHSGDDPGSAPISSKQIWNYFDTVMSNPESRKISYFLALNLAYMAVQITYGVWTNSLGLISDAIHMFFDCMAIAMGLFASIMATWSPNERFTYGYGRIETLSGFANGIFLILISIFIVFEAIQRILDPPEMSTSQLLLVSSMGLGVNLFGMFAMGGHHHHGHGHSHGHDHSHSHSHSHSDYHAHHDHDHDHDRNHGHDHSDDHEIDHHHEEEHFHNHTASPTSAASDELSRKLTRGRGRHHGHEDLGAHDHHHHSGDHSHTHTESHIRNHSQLDHDHDHDHAHSHDHHTHIPVAEHDHDEHHNPPALSLDRSHAFSHSSNDHGHSSFHLMVPDTDESPVTPSYSFTHDKHVAEHHPEHMHNHHPHSHDHGHSHNMRGVFLHVMADTLGSVGVIVSTLLIQLYGWTGFDPIASLFIAALIVASVVPLVIDCGRVLSLDLGGNEDAVRRALAEISYLDGVESYSHPRFWPKDAETTVGSITVALARSPQDERQLRLPLADTIQHVERILRSGIPSLSQVVVQVE